MADFFVNFTGRKLYNIPNYRQMKCRCGYAPVVNAD